MKIAFVGMMGAGKTTLGQSLAAKMSLPFIDSDREIEKLTGTSVFEIIIGQGEDHFRTLESAVISNVIQTTSFEKSGVVFSLGGGAFHQTIQSLLKSNNFITIYLQCDLATLIERVGQQEKREQNLRPLLTPKDEAQTVAQRMQEILKRREKQYFKADIILKNNHPQLEIAMSHAMTQINDWINRVC